MTLDTGKIRTRTAENQRETTPRLMVGSWAGEAAVVEARTGRVCWLRRTRRELGTFVHGGERGSQLLSGYALRRMQTDLLCTYDRSHAGDRYASLRNTPAHLEARRASDSALLWTYSAPKGDETPVV